MRAPDAGDSAAISGIFPHLYLFLTGRLHPPGEANQPSGNYVLNRLEIKRTIVLMKIVADSNAFIAVALNKPERAKIIRQRSYGFCAYLRLLSPDYALFGCRARKILCLRTSPHE